MKNKTVIVTGANTGMGFALTVDLAKKGATVIMACRSQERGEKALQEAKAKSGSNQLELMLCDLGSLDSIRSFTQVFLDKYDTLDVLINNAGVFSMKRSLTKDGFETMLGVNHLGHFLLTNLLLESLKRSSEGRIVNVSSGAHKAGMIHWNDPYLTKGYNFWKGYAQSKLANILFTVELAERLQGTRVTVNSLHPGAVATSIGVDRDTGFGKKIMGLMKPFFLNAEQGAATTLYLATSDEVREISGEYFYKKKKVTVKEPKKDRQLAQRLWAWSEQEVKLV